MTQIFKIEVKNAELIGKLPTLYFETKEAAEAVINAFDAMAVKGKKLEWECSIIEVLSKEDAYEQFLSIAKDKS